MPSVRTRLTALLLGVIAVTLVPFLLLTYSNMMEELDELSDARLAQSARTLKRLIRQLPPDAHSSTIVIPSRPALDARTSSDEASQPNENEIGFQFWSNESTLQLATSDLRELPLHIAPTGYADVAWQSHEWRIFTLQDPNGAITRAAERYDSREEIEHDLLLQDIAPFLFLIPLLAILVRWAIARALSPIQHASDQLQGRSRDDLSPIPVFNPPREIAPLLDALNATLARIRGVLENERQFTSNAAHELRTPLAGLTVQLTNAAATTEEDARREAIEEAHRGVDRMARIVNQMLDLARWDAATQRREFSAVNLEECIAEELSGLSALIVQRDIEIRRSFAPPGLPCLGWESGITTIMRNLLENAVRYSDEHGRIDIEGYVEDEHPVIAVSDTGPGIPPSVREILLQRFARGENVPSSGSGLGLSIVGRIVSIHGARLVLTQPKHGYGLRVEVHFSRGAIA